MAYILEDQALAQQLLSVARQAAPDPGWGDRLRQFKAWSDPEALGKLVEEAPLERLSPQMLALCGHLLRRQSSSLHESWLRRAQAQYPADFWLNFDLGHALSETQPVEAAGFYRAALAVRPTSTATYNNLGNCLRKQNRLNDALAAFDKAIEIDAEHYFAHVNIGKILCDDLKDYENAEARFRKAIEIDPKRASTHVNLSIALVHQGKLVAAVSACRKAIEIDPKLAPAHCSLGRALAKQGKPGEAVAAYNQAIEIDPKHVSAHVSLGAILCDHLRDYAKAADAFRKVIEIDPKYAGAYFNLGNALHRQGKSGEAITAYRKAIEIDPKNAGAYFMLGNALCRQGKSGEAITAFRKAIEIDPKDDSAHLQLGAILCDDLKDYEKAVACFRKAIEIDPKRALTHYNLGIALYHQNKPDEAIAAFRKAIEINPKFSNAKAHLAGALSSRGWQLANLSDPEARDLERALELGKQAVQLAPQSRVAWRGLGWVYYRAGNWRESIDAIERAGKLQASGKGDANEWIVLALAHARLADQPDLSEQQRADHQTQARRWYEKADQQINAWYRVRPEDDSTTWDFREEAKKLIGREKQKIEQPPNAIH